MRVKGIKQNSPAWIRSRLGHVTASRVGDITKTLKSGNEPAQKTKYRKDVVLERLRGFAARHVVTDPMQRGIDLEPYAGEAIEIKKGVFLETGGWWLHDSIRWFGASPDFLLPDGLGLVEVKVPLSDHHLDFWKYGWQEKEESCRMWEAQMNAQMACTGREYVDFYSFDPSHPHRHLRLWEKRFKRDDKVIRGLEAEIVYFLEEVEREVNDYLRLPEFVIVEQEAR